MRLSRKEVQHIAELARIGLMEEEIEKFRSELSLILDYIANLDGVDTAHIAAMSHAAGICNAMRKDEVEHNPDIAGKVLEQTPERKNGYVKVKAVS